MPCPGPVEEHRNIDLEGCMSVASWGNPEVKVNETIPHLQGWATSGTVTFYVKDSSADKKLSLTFPFQDAESQPAAVRMAATQLLQVAAAFSQEGARILNLSYESQT